MKKAILLATMVFSLLLAPSVHAYTTPLHKLYAGVKQVITGPFSIITVPVEQLDREHDKMLGLIGGLMEGAVQTAVKPLQGLFNIVTFPFVE
ncbi:MAG TPA: hypothetical protein VI749_07995 [Candidatus Omnitrophota bacterium]|nr:hypothetical protein [Candidatus Omnitrophota bacterium]